MGGGFVCFCSGLCPPKASPCWELGLRRHPLPLGQAVALRAGSPRESRTGASQSGEIPLPPPPLLRPASPMRFVIFLLGLQRRQLAPDLSSNQFTHSATKQTELVSARTLYNSHSLWGGRGFVCCSWGRCPKTLALTGAWPAAPSARARPGFGGAARTLASRVAYCPSQSGETLPHHHLFCARPRRCAFQSSCLDCGDVSERPT